MEFMCCCCERKSIKQELEPIPWCLNCIRTSPVDWGQMNLSAIRMSSSSSQPTYLLTFTRNPNSRYSLDSWLDRVVTELCRKPFTDVRCSLEHVSTNIHCHALITYNSKGRLGKDKFTVFARDYGFVDLRRVNSDNGVIEYISKDLPPDIEPVQPLYLKELFHTLIGNDLKE